MSVQRYFRAAQLGLTIAAFSSRRYPNAGLNFLSSGKPVLQDTAGTVQLTVGTDGITIATAMLWPNGTVSAPSATFASDTDTGLYRAGANNPAMAAGGAKVGEWSSSGYTPTLGIAAAGGFSIKARCFHSGGRPPYDSTDGTDSTPSATETYFCEIFVPANTTVTGLSVFNGSAVGTDKLIAIIWDSTGAVVATSALAGITASGTDAFQDLVLTAPVTLKGPATYFVGIQCNGTTYRYNAHSIGRFGCDKKTGTTFGTAPSITPPTTFVGTGPMITLY